MVCGVDQARLGGGEIPKTNAVGREGEEEVERREKKREKGRGSQKEETRASYTTTRRS
jgi:hypothetical protein